MTTWAIGLTVAASILFDVVAKETLGFVPGWMMPTKLAVLALAALYFARVGNPRMSRYALILIGLVALPAASVRLGKMALWQSLFDLKSFSGYFGSMVLLKLLSTIPLVGLMLLLFDSPREAYLAKGNLSAPAEPIPWLGIRRGMITWGRLSVFSAFAIAIGTLLLTMLTVTGFSRSADLGRLTSQLPAVIGLALINSLAEGLMFRNAVLGSLRHMLPKSHALLIAAGFFGMAHYYGAPSGVVGVLMSGVLGWYLSRSMYETGGLVAPWIIHFMQDVVIFATFALLTVYI